MGSRKERQVLIDVRASRAGAGMGIVVPRAERDEAATYAYTAADG